MRRTIAITILYCLGGAVGLGISALVTAALHGNPHAQGVLIDLGIACGTAAVICALAWALKELDL
jgi:hypothetical protein